MQVIEAQSARSWSLTITSITSRSGRSLAALRAEQASTACYRPPGVEVSQARIGPGRRCSACASGPLGSGLVLPNDAGGDAPPGADRDALGLCPRPDAPAAVPAGCGPPTPAGLSPPGLAGMLDERCELAAQRSSCSDRSHTRRHRPRIAPFHRPGPIKIILEFDGYLLCHPGLLAALEIPAPRSTVLAAGTYGAGSRPQRIHPPSRTRSAQPRQPAPRTRCVPIAYENRLVVADVSPATSMGPP